MRTVFDALQYRLRLLLGLRFEKGANLQGVPAYNTLIKSPKVTKQLTGQDLLFGKSSVVCEMENSCDVE